MLTGFQHDTAVNFSEKPSPYFPPKVQTCCHCLCSAHHTQWHTTV